MTQSTNNLFQQAITLHHSGNLPEAEAAYRTILEHDANHADALALLGVVLASRGDVEQGLGFANRSIELAPQSPMPWFHRANILMGIGRLDEAISDFGQVITIQDNLAEAHYNLGNALRAAQRWHEAKTAYAKAMACNPDLPAACNNLALCHVHEKSFQTAMILAQELTQRFPDYADGWITLGNVAEKLNDYDLALSAAERAVRLAPANPYAWFGYGVALNRVDRNDEAVRANLQGLQLKPDYADLWDNLGQSLQSLGKLEEAEKAFRTCLEVSGQAIPDDRIMAPHLNDIGNRHWHLALLELLQGKYRIGFARYRARFDEMAGLRKPNYNVPVWCGETLSGKTILVTDEQGFGDSLMLARFLPRLKDMGARVIFSVHPALCSYFSGWGAVDKICVHGDAVTGHDYVVSIFDLPHWLGITLDNLSGATYLPRPEIPADKKLPDTGRRRIGLVWGGSPVHVNDRKRSVPLSMLQPLVQGYVADYYSFNRDLRAGDDQLIAAWGIKDITPNIHDFSQSAIYLQQMDLIISCDTSTVHLAGGMGKPVSVMLPFLPDWRWLMGRMDSPWYHSVRLYRQQAPGDWQGTIARIVNDIKNGHNQ